MAARENWWRRPVAGDRPWIIAHRGDSAHAPENTVEAARLAHQVGADAWELDVQLTRDGVPVVLHDESLRRTTNVEQRFEHDPRAAAGFLVADFDLAEIRTLDAGSWFLAPQGVARSASGFGTLDRIDAESCARFGSGQVRIPTLVEALELTKELDWSVNVELKSVPSAEPETARRVLEIVMESGIRDRVLISSFDHAEVAWIARRAPEVATAALTTTPVFQPALYCRDFLGVDAYHPWVEAVGAGSTAYRRQPSAASLRREDLDELRRRGVPVSVFTVNDSRPDGLAEHLAAAGVSGLFTDDPAALRGRWDR